MFRTSLSGAMLSTSLEADPTQTKSIGKGRAFVESDGNSLTNINRLFRDCANLTGSMHRADIVLPSHQFTNLRVISRSTF